MGKLKRGEIVTMSDEEFRQMFSRPKSGNSDEVKMLVVVFLIGLLFGIGIML